VLGTYIHLYGDKARQANPALPPDFPFSNPFPIGVKGFLLSPHRSVFLFEPLLVVTIGIALRHWRHIRTPIALFVAGTLALLAFYIVFYARYAYWAGGASWGPRFLLVPSELASLVAVPVLAETWSRFGRVGRTLALCVVTFAAVVQLESLVLWDNLEEAQAQFRGGPALVPWERASNLFAVASGRFEESARSYPGFAPRHITPNFTVFLARPSLSPRAWRPLVAVWAITAAALVIAALRLARAHWAEIRSTAALPSNRAGAPPA
jgi:hypothetical protein